MNCIVDGCPQQVTPEGGNFCWAHYKRKARGVPASAFWTPVQPRPEHPQAALLANALRLAEVDSSDDGEFYRAANALRMAAVRYVKKLHRRTRSKSRGYVGRAQ